MLSTEVFSSFRFWGITHATRSLFLSQEGGWGGRGGGGTEKDGKGKERESSKREMALPL